MISIPSRKNPPVVIIKAFQFKARKVTNRNPVGARAAKGAPTTSHVDGSVKGNELPLHEETGLGEER